MASRRAAVRLTVAVKLLNGDTSGFPRPPYEVMSQTLIPWQQGTLTSQDLEVSLVQATNRNVPLLDYLIRERNVPEGMLAETSARH